MTHDIVAMSHAELMKRTRECVTMAMGLIGLEIGLMMVTAGIAMLMMKTVNVMMVVMMRMTKSVIVMMKALTAMVMVWEGLGNYIKGEHTT